MAHRTLLVRIPLSAHAHMAEIYRARSKVRRAAVLTSHRLAHSVNGAQVEHEIPPLREDLTAELALHLATKAVTIMISDRKIPVYGVKTMLLSLIWNNQQKNLTTVILHKLNLIPFSQYVRT